MAAPVKSSLRLIMYLTVEAYGEWEVDPCILNLDRNWRWREA